MRSLHPDKVQGVRDAVLPHRRQSQARTRRMTPLPQGEQLALADRMSQLAEPGFRSYFKPLTPVPMDSARLPWR